ncbi:type IV pilus assembly protein PilZ [Leptospira ryugenii]|uniref:Type IV pilus assembly protein PilZ n=1 Tax=Leptospira ryugenii TaxID=1917863 RepID=A0A2P2DY05_9LEPT|nr:PilZ domain-containing protein [Leptospira ryugenii]GBF49486.1 type IV pilus assembly protein PilZ [Leptospira ryugenii]
MALRLFRYPYPILVVSLLFVVIPLLNYFFTAALYDLSSLQSKQVFSRIQPLQYVLSILSLVIAYGLLAKKKFGYYLFLLFASILASYNVWMIAWISLGKKLFLAGVRLQGPEIIVNAVMTFVALAMIFYFLKREVSAPYLSSLNRGWRGGYRETHPVPFHWTNSDGEREGDGFTINISGSGALIPLVEHHFLKIGSEINLHLKLENEKREIVPISVKGEVVRLDQDEEGTELAGVRFDFQAAQKDEEAEFLRFLKRVFAPRFPVQNKIHAGKKEANESSGELVNISTEGMYIKSDIVYDLNDRLFIKIDTRSGPISLKALVRWSNPNGRYGKPKGYGLQIEEVENPTRFRFWVWKHRFRIFHER